MASTAQHLAVAAHINTKCFNFKGDDLTEFFLGAIVCDAPNHKIKSIMNEKFPNKMRKIGRSHSHFLPGSIIPENLYLQK